jgi:hypothetical protein
VGGRVVDQALAGEDGRDPVGLASSTLLEILDASPPDPGCSVP